LRPENEQPNSPDLTQSGLLQDMSSSSEFSLVVSAYRRQTEAALAERLALQGPLRHSVTDDATIHILVHVCGQM